MGSLEREHVARTGINPRTGLHPLVLHRNEIARLAGPLGLEEGVDYVEQQQIPLTGDEPKFAMRIGFPPCYLAAVERFPFVRGKPIIFAYAPYIYVTNGARCGPEKVAHEVIHLARQTANGMTVERWWAKYLEDTAFRYDEEVLAHVAEYLFLCEKQPGRGARRRNLVTVAANLASPIYGRMITVDDAKALLKSCAAEAGKLIDEDSGGHQPGHEGV